MKILIVSPFFPPMATVAIVRISSLARQLLKEGHELTVIRNEFNCEVDTLSESYSDLLTLKTYKVKLDQNTRYFEAARSYKKIFRKVLNKQKFDVVFITAGPYYTIPLCKIAKKEYNTKCIIDYRDLWIFDIRSKKEFIKPINLAKKMIYFPIEKQNIKYADLVVTVTDNWKNILSRVYRTGNFEVIPNGYDDEQLNKIDHPIDNPFNGKFVISFFGKLSYYSVDYGVKFFKTIKKLQSVYPDLIVLHIGLSEKETNEAIRISDFDKEKYINTGFLDYKEGIKLLTKSNVNMIIDIRKSAMGTKFYDYVYVNKPLIYFGKKNTTLDQLTNEFENGFCCYSESDLIRAIRKIRENNISSLTKSIKVQDYARSKQNKKYIQLMKNVVYS